MYKHPEDIYTNAKTLMRVGEHVADYMKQILDQNGIPQCHIRLTVSIDKYKRGIAFELSETEYFGVVVKGFDPIAVLDEFCRRKNWHNLNKPITTKLIAARGSLDSINSPDEEVIPL